MTRAVPEGDPRLQLAQRLGALWRCEPDGSPFTTASSLLWPLRQAGRPVMLKIVDPEDDEVGGAAVLRALEGQGAVRVLECDGPAMLMERVVAGEGRTLEEMVLDGRDDEATILLCEVVARMHGALPPATDLPLLIPFDRRLKALRDALNREDVPDPARRVLRRAAAAAGEMLEDGPVGWRPLHGDIHHGNVLLDRRRGWLAIDPKGLRGPAGYDYANLLCNPLALGREVAKAGRMARQVGIVAERTSMDGGEVLRWTWVHASLSVAWSLGEPDMTHWLACAETAEAMASG